MCTQDKLGLRPFLKTNQEKSCLKVQTSFYVFVGLPLGIRSHIRLLHQRIYASKICLMLLIISCTEIVPGLLLESVEFVLNFMASFAFFVMLGIKSRQSYIPRKCPKSAKHTDRKFNS